MQPRHAWPSPPLQPRQQQQQQQQQARPFETNAATITAAIKRCHSAVQLLAVLSQHGDSFNYIHVSAMFAKLAKLPTANGSIASGPTAPTSTLPAAAPMPFAPTAAAGEAARSAAEAASLARAEAEATAKAAVTDALLQRLEQHLPQFGPRALANTLWALGKLGCLPPKRIVATLLAELDVKVQELKGYEHSMALYALAELQQQVQQRAWQQLQARQRSFAGGGTGSMELQSHQHQQLPRMHQQPQQQLQPAQQRPLVQQYQLQQHQRKPSPALSARLLLLSRQELGLHEQRLSCYLEAAAASFSDFGPQALSNTLYALAAMGLTGQQLESWLPRFWAASEQLLVASPGDFQPQHLSNLMWAHGRLEVPPPAQWLAAWQAAAAPQLGKFTGQGCSNMLWGLVKAGAVPEVEWLNRFVHATAGRLAGFSEHALSNCCWALARLSADGIGSDIGSSTMRINDVSGSWPGSSAGTASFNSSTSSSSSSSSSSVCGGVGRATVLQLLSESGWMRSMLEVSHRRWVTQATLHVYLALYLAAHCKS